LPIIGLSRKIGIWRTRISGFRGLTIAAPGELASMDLIPWKTDVESSPSRITAAGRAEKSID